jgi:hypothetical protein
MLILYWLRVWSRPAACTALLFHFSSLAGTVHAHDCAPDTFPGSGHLVLISTTLRIQGFVIGVTVVFRCLQCLVVCHGHGHGHGIFILATHAEVDAERKKSTVPWLSVLPWSSSCGLLLWVWLWLWLLSGPWWLSHHVTATESMSATCVAWRMPCAATVTAAVRSLQCSDVAARARAHLELLPHACMHACICTCMLPASRQQSLRCTHHQARTHARSRSPDLLCVHSFTWFTTHLHDLLSTINHNNLLLFTLKWQSCTKPYLLGAHVCTFVVRALAEKKSP